MTVVSIKFKIKPINWDVMFFFKINSIFGTVFFFTFELSPSEDVKVCWHIIFIVLHIYLCITLDGKYPISKSPAVVHTRLDGSIIPLLVSRWECA